MARMKVQCCVVGGGPAGVMLGYLLARASVSVCVLEKHADFFRDFRGDTVHPSTMTALDELGILDDFLRIPHAEISHLGGKVGRDTVWIADFKHVAAKTKFIAIMPQWDLLNFLAERARAFPTFSLLMNAAAQEPLTDANGRIVGVRATTPQGPLEIEADLVVAADGRSSTIRDAVGMVPIDFNAPMDVLWFRLDRREGDPASAFGYIGAGYFLVTINRNDYWQCGFVIRKGQAEAVQREGLEVLRRKVSAVVPAFADRLQALQSWDEIKTLSVAVNRLERWHRPGLLFIGDAAHAMSPVGGVGINLAVQDAIAAARILRPFFFQPAPIPESALAAVQARREWPAKITQRLQVILQKRVISVVLSATEVPERAPLPLRMISSFPLIQWLPATLVGLGFRPEHIDR